MHVFAGLDFVFGFRERVQVPTLPPVAEWSAGRVVARLTRPDPDELFFPRVRPLSPLSHSGTTSAQHSLIGNKDGRLSPTQTDELHPVNNRLHPGQE